MPRIVGLVLAVALVGGLLVLSEERGRDDEAVAPARTDGTAVRCPAGASAAKPCAERAVRARAARDHPLEVEDVSCTLQPSRGHVFQCNVALRTTCDAYVARYARGMVRVTQPGRLYCIHVEEEAAVELHEE